MTRRSGFLIGIAAFFLGPVSLPLSHAGFRDEPVLTKTQADDLRALPYSLSGQTSLVIRRKHVRSVSFSGMGEPGDFGYVAGDGIMRQGLWLRLHGTSGQAVIEFDNPVEGDRYNSLVLWVRARSGAPQFWVAVEDAAWTESDIQARTLSIPYGGLPSNDPVQLAIPFSRVLSRPGVDWSRIKRIRLNYPAGSTIEILGLAFIRQEKRLPAIRLDNPTAKPVVVKKPPPRPVKTVPPAVEKVEDAEVEPVDIPPPSRPEISVLPLLSFPAKRFPIQNIGLVLGLVAGVSFVFYLAILIRRRQPAASAASLDRVLQEVEWPQGSGFDEDQFWRDYSSLRVGQSWLGVPHASLPPNGGEEIFGETFLKRQLEAAERAGLRLVPSVCFVRTKFNYESFLAHPDLFLTKKITKKETHLSDEELRSRHVGFFPAWIPPYWQKKNNLPQRIMVSYGKLPGALFTTDSVQYNLRSPELREAAVRLLSEFARRAPGVRIEGAAALLNSTIKLYWGSLMDTTRSLSSEFWSDVIPRVKEKNPDFKFMADSAGLEFAALRELGFETCENDRVRDVMVNQIKLEKADRVEKVLAEQAGNFSRSIYDLTPILTGEGASPALTDQNTLATVLLGLLPGRINLRGSFSSNLSNLLRARSRSATVQMGQFALLESDKPSLLSFARFHRNQAVLVLANFSKAPIEARVQLGPILSGLDEKRLYLFNDVLHGTAVLKDISAEQTEGPAMAVWGQDLKLKGFPAALAGLSLKIISVSLSSPITLSQGSPTAARATQ